MPRRHAHFENIAPGVFNNPLGSHQPRQRPGAWPFHFDQNGKIVFPHPYAWTLAPSNNRANAGFNVTGAAAAVSSAPTPAPAQPAPKADNANPGRLGQYQVSQAAQQLRSQIDESKEVFEKFHSSYKEDVKKVQSYASDDVLPRLWADKIRQNHKTDDGQEDSQLLYQRDKLATCLKRMVDATVLSSPSGDYDSRELHFEKIRAAGTRVNRLCERALDSDRACKDLIDELEELSSLVGPQSRAAVVLYRFDKRKQAAESLSSGGGQDEANAAGYGGGDDNAHQENQENGQNQGASSHQDDAAADFRYGGGEETVWK